jgi:hypothetical protein
MYLRMPFSSSPETTQYLRLSLCIMILLFKIYDSPYGRHDPFLISSQIISFIAFILLVIVSSLVPMFTYIDVVYWALPLGMGCVSMVLNLRPCCVHVKTVGLGLMGIFIMATAITSTVTGVHILDNVDENRCSYDEGIDDQTTSGRRLEHTCGSWLGFAITMLVDILLLIFFIRYNKFDINGGEAATNEEEGDASVGVANSLSKINASNAAGPEIETAQEV